MRALFSTYDKTGVAQFAAVLAAKGWDIISSGGTAGAIRDAGINVTDVADLTGAPAILGHRVMTLHPKVHGGLLADRNDESHLADMAEHGIEGIDLVVVNLYPFGSDPSVFSHGGASGAIDLIDIGGPAMIRAGAKNHAHVAVVVDVADYASVGAEVSETGAISSATRLKLAAKAFATTAAYDAAIARWFAGETREFGAPERLVIEATLEPVTLRYGENPHQSAALYRTVGANPWWSTMTLHSGLAMSYLNLYDADAAWLLAHDLAQSSGKVACAIIKHANPCGAAVADSAAEAYRLAFECDPRSAFGGIVAVSAPIDEGMTEAMVAAAQADVVIAPGYGPGAVEALVAKRKNTRLIEAVPPTPDNQHVRPVTGGYLVQDPHEFVAQPSSWKVVTARQPSEAEMADAILAFRLCGWVKSNSIVLVKDGVAWGIGAGQQNRVEAGQIAAAKAAGRAGGGACASDAFYPFADGVEAAAEAGVAVVVQPGGSVRDDDVIAAANRLGLAMVFTGERHFLH